MLVMDRVMMHEIEMVSVERSQSRDRFGVSRSCEGGEIRKGSTHLDRFQALSLILLGFEFDL